MAPSRLEIPQLTVPQTHQFDSPTTPDGSDLELDSGTLSPRTMYAQSFDRPDTSRSLPNNGAVRYRKNMNEMTGNFMTTEEEFEALPIAVRRKYFSTLERLRFAQTSRSNALNEIPVQRTRKASLADRRGIRNTPVLEAPRNAASSRRLRRISLTKSVSSDEASWFLTLPEKIKKREYTREEQVILAGRLRDSVILDAADEAIYKASRRASRNLSPLADIATPTSPAVSEYSSIMGPDSPNSSAEAAFYESFRWMDEEQDLDLKLSLDDYHANLHGAVLPNSESGRRPSFRRTMSISKMPFGRNSLSALPPRSPVLESGHGRSKSRTISLMAPKRMNNDSVSSFDAGATHYQDPEARLKLRVYLASPQKFDEAIEFGFPSMDGLMDEKENKAPRCLKETTGGNRSYVLEPKSGQSFLLNEKDSASLFGEDDASMMDPDSPITPMDGGMGFKPHHRAGLTTKESKSLSDITNLKANKPMVVKKPEAYTQAMAGSREMTLRMTLTRPDLRADETTIYGWKSAQSMGALREEDLDGDVSDMRGPYGGIDGWGERDSGVVKRFWTKIRSQRKTSSQ